MRSTMSGYWAANVWLLSGPHETVVTARFAPIPVSSSAHIERRPRFVAGSGFVTNVLYWNPISGSAIDLADPAFVALASCQHAITARRDVIETPCSWPETFEPQSAVDGAGSRSVVT